ncbi:MAG: cadmium-translocating P-type ATPase [Clostridia bacterium]|nr:cadmium-translocating P-type ATPase [Clostridia bacterium]
MKEVIKIQGLDCPVCAGELRELLEKVDGVEEIAVSHVDQKVFVDYDGRVEVLDKIKETINGFEEVRVVEEEEIVLRIENLHCAACALDLQKDIAKIKGVESVQVDFITQTIRLKATPDAVTKTIKKANKFEQVRVLDGGRYEMKAKRGLDVRIALAVSAVGFLLGLLCSHLFKGVIFEILSYVFFFGAYLVVGYPVLLSTAKNCLKGKFFDENFLMTVASIGAFALGQFDEGVAVMLLYQLGEWLQSVAVGASRNSVTELMALKSERAKVLRDSEWVEVKPEELKIGERVRINAGDKIPADGVLVSDEAVLDVKSLTGESEFKTLVKGEELLSGCINQGNAVEMQITRKYEDSAVGKILDLVENATAKKAKPEKFITRFAKYYTPIVCMLAFAIAVFVPLALGLLEGNGLYFKDFGRWLNTALILLVISCPCALIISVPLTYFSGIGTCAKKGVLVKGATYLDELARAKVFAFDKTGTLTKGEFALKNVLNMGQVRDEELISVISALEKYSSHPIAKAFEKYSSELIVEDVEEFAGKGLRGRISGEEVLVGNAKFLNERGIQTQENPSPYTVIHASRNGSYLGAIALADEIRMESKQVISRLKTLGGERTIILTGDRADRAKDVANEIGMDEFKAELLPDQKLSEAEKLKARGGLVYVGDGINDAPVMKVADCAVSMGKLGSSVAVEASDVVLIADDLKGLVEGVKVAKKTKKIVWQNIIFSVLMKFAFMGLGVAGVLPLSLAVFADVGVMLLAVLNSLRMRFGFERGNS